MLRASNIIKLVLPCLTECPDPEDTSVVPPELSAKDVCRVQVGAIRETRECVPVARVDTMRKLIGEKRREFTHVMKG